MPSGSMIGEAFVRVRPDTSGFGGELNSGVKKGMGGVGKIIGAGVLGAAGIAAGGLALVLRGGMKEWVDSTKVAAQTEAVIKSTGGSANVTAKQVDNLASALLNKSGVDDEAIKSGENMLLTFTNIKNETGKGNDIFNQATKSILDMDTAMTHGNVTAESMAHSSILVGKALNDPIKGVGALSRVGVTFTEQQKETIKTLVKSGKTLEAQKIIVHELNKEFGGSAAAIGATLPGKINILREHFKNLQGDIFAKLVPALTRVVDWVDKHWDQIEDVFRAVFNGIGFAITRIFVPAVQAIIKYSKIAVAYIREHWPEIREIALRVFNAIAPVVTNTMNTIRSIIQGIWTTISYIWRHYGDLILAQTRAVFEFIRGSVQNFMQVIRGIVNVIGGLIHGDFGRVWEGIKQIFGGMSAQVLNIFRYLGSSLVRLLEAAGRLMLAALVLLAGRALSAARSVGTAIKNGVVAGLVGLTLAVIAPFQRLWGWIKGAVNSAHTFAVQIGKAIMHGIADGISSLFGWLKDKVVGAVKGIFDGAKGFLHIGSPSKLFADQIGKPMAQGIAAGFISGMIGLGTTMTSEINNAVKKGVKAKNDALAAVAKSQRADLAESLTSNRFAGIGTTVTPAINRAIIAQLQSGGGTAAGGLTTSGAALGGLTAASGEIAKGQAERDARQLAELREQTRLQQEIASNTGFLAGRHERGLARNRAITSVAARLAAEFGF